MFTDLVLHDADGFVKGGDDEVAGSGADDLVEMDRVVVNGEGNGSGNIGSYGERCSVRIKTEGKDQGASPNWAQLVEGGKSTEDLGLGLVGIG